MTERKHDEAKEQAAPPPEPSPADEKDETARDKLKEAEQALAAKNGLLAERLANSVINSDGAGPNQRMHAAAIHGIVQCRFNNDHEHAQIDLRKVKTRLLRRRLVEACSAVGITLDDQQ